MGAHICRKEGLKELCTRKRFSSQKASSLRGSSQEYEFGGHGRSDLHVFRGFMLIFVLLTTAAF